MTTTAETTDIIAAMAKTPPARQAVFMALVKTHLSETGYLPQPILGQSGELIGLLVPQGPPPRGEPPRLSPEREAELHRRLTAPDHEFLSAEDFMNRMKVESRSRR